MIIEKCDVGFVVKAEDANDRALLTAFDKNNKNITHNLIIKGSIYECDYHAVTSFIFGWVKKPFTLPKNVIDGKDWAEAMF